MTINSKQHQAEFMPVYDGRNAKIRGLWKRGDKFYARLSIAYSGEDHPKVIPLKATNLTDARKEQRQLMVSRDTGEAITLRLPPRLLKG